jgi:cysteine-rich repeat protein
MVFARCQRYRLDGLGAPAARGSWVVVLLAALPGVALASISTRALDPGLTAAQLARALVGDGVAVSNVRYTGAPEAAGVFGAATTSVGFERGLILSSGPVSGIAGPNDSAEFGLGNTLREPGDADLGALVRQETEDAAVLEFDFVPASNEIVFNYVFASDEYSGEGSRDGADDVFGVFVNGQNRALLPGGSIISVDTVNGGFPLGRNAKNPMFFVDNTACVPGCPFDFEADGKTVVLPVRAPVNAGVVNHVKLAIADATDGQIDSWVFVQTKSFPHLVEDCTNGVDDDVDGLVDKADPDCAVCGDRVVDPGEECDDGNVTAGDGCGPTCLLEVPPASTTTTVPADPCMTPSGPRDCDDGNPCTADRCDAVAGCVHDPAPFEGRSCADGNACTDQDRCIGGTCTGSNVACDDGDSCTADSCDPSAGCIHVTARADGTACDDGDPCTVADACGNGVCVGARACGPDIPPGSERTTRKRVVKVGCTGEAGATCAMELVPDAVGGGGAAARAGTASGVTATAPRFTKRVKPKKISRSGIVMLKLVVTSSGWKLLDTSPEHHLSVRARATIVSQDGSIRVSAVPFLLLSPRRRGGG